MITRLKTGPFHTLLATALAFALAGPVAAADGSEGNSSASEDAASASEISDAQLEQFAEAYGQIRSVQAEYAPKIRNTDDKQKRAKLKRQGREEMASAIQDVGLKVAEYQQIGQALNGSRELQARLQKIMQEAQAGSGSGGQDASGESSQ